MRPSTFWAAPSASLRWITAGVGALCFAGSGSPASAQITDDWTRNFRLGVQVGFNIKANFALNGDIPVTGASPGPVSVPGVDHYYNDGYVRVDNTGNAGGQTSFWGYTQSSQYDPATHQLFMRSVRSFEASSQTSANDSPYVGLDVAYGGQIRDWGKTRLGWEVGYGFTPLNIKDTTTIPASFTRVVQSFDTGGIILPTPPYAGGASGLGPTIRDIATPHADETPDGFITGSRALDVSLHAIRLGPTIFWRFQPRWALSGSLGPALGIVPGSYKYNQTLVLNDGGLAYDSGKISHTDVVFGGYAAATLHCRIVAQADLYASVQILSLQNAEFGNSQRQGELELHTAIMTSFGVNWPF